MPAKTCFDEHVQRKVLSRWGFVNYLTNELASIRRSSIVMPGPQNIQRKLHNHKAPVLHVVERTHCETSAIWLRIRCELAAGAGVVALAVSCLLKRRGTTAASFFLDEAADWGAEMAAAIGFVTQCPQCCRDSVY